MGGGESCTGEGRIIRLERLEKKKERERESRRNRNGVSERIVSEGQWIFGN